MSTATKVLYDGDAMSISLMGFDTTAVPPWMYQVLDAWDKIMPDLEEAFLSGDDVTWKGTTTPASIYEYVPSFQPDRFTPPFENKFRIQAKGICASQEHLQRMLHALELMVPHIVHTHRSPIAIILGLFNRGEVQLPTAD